MKTGRADHAGTFVRAMELPVLSDQGRRKCIHVVGVFSAHIAADHVDEWLMQPDGKPRSDRELAKEVLIEIRKPLRAHGRSAPHALSVTHILQLDSAAAIVVSTFLATLPRTTGRYWTRNKFLPPAFSQSGQDGSPAAARALIGWKEV